MAAKKKKKASAKKKPEPAEVPVEEIKEVVEDVAEVIEVVVEGVIDTMEDNPELLLAALALQTGIGSKSPAYLRFVLENKDGLNAEYEKVKHLIEKYVK